MTSRALYTQAHLQEWITLLSGRSLPVTVSVLKGVKRTTLQNRLAHKWYAQIAHEEGETTELIKARCKLRFARPILIRDNPEWVEKHGAKLDSIHERYGYGEMLEYQAALTPMTSLMKIAQLSEMMDQMQFFYRPQGVALVDPDARKATQ